jgi:hypothetical protein
MRQEGCCDTQWVSISLWSQAQMKAAVFMALETLN